MKKWLCVMLALMMCLSLLPASVLASEEPETLSEIVVEDETGQVEEIVEFTEMSEESMTEPEIVKDEIISAEMNEGKTVEVIVAETAKTLAANEGIVIDEANFPDPVFRAYVSENIDIDGDGAISNSEVKMAVFIDVKEKGITSLKGIEYFTALTQLNCYDNSLTSLDVSQNNALTHLWCYSNSLTSLDVSANTALIYLDCYDNNLTLLDVSGCTTLRMLSCGNNNLTTLDVNKNTALTWLYCNNNDLTTLDLSKNPALRMLFCRSNGLTTLDVNQNTALIELGCGSNRLTSLDVSHNTTLEQLDCSNNDLTTLDVSKNTVLKYLFCENNDLASLDVSQNTALTLLTCTGNCLTMLDISHCKPIISRLTNAVCNTEYGCVIWSTDAASDPFLAFDSSVTLITTVTQIILSELDADTEATFKKAANIGSDGENFRTYDVKLQMLSDDGQTWVDVTSENFPEDGVMVTFDYPNGTDAAMRFVIYHLLASGKVEMLTPTKTDSGLTVVVHSLSPFAITWDSAAEMLLGDADGDGEITGYDASLILQHEVGLIVDDDIDLSAADVDGDGEITGYDASLILQYEVGLITTFANS